MGRSIHCTLIVRNDVPNYPILIPFQTLALCRSVLARILPQLKQSGVSVPARRNLQRGSTI